MSNLDNIRSANLESLHHEPALPDLSFRSNSSGSIEDADRRSAQIASVFTSNRATDRGCSYALRSRDARRTHEGDPEHNRVEDALRRSQTRRVVSEKRGIQPGFTIARKALYRVRRR